MKIKSFYNKMLRMLRFFYKDDKIPMIGESNMKINVSTLGCKVNVYDSESIAMELINHGYSYASEGEEADVYIINTCAVTNESERKCRQLIRKTRSLHPDALIVVTGCYSETRREDVEAIEGIDIITGTSDRSETARLILEHFGEKTEERDGEKELSAVTTFEGRTRAVIKVQDGCKMFCKYCIIPYARNKMLSANADEVVAQVKEIIKSGFREITLTGIHLASYRDNNGNKLIDLIEKIDKDTSLERLRLGSLEPRLLSEDFLKRLREVRSFCPHFHLSLQSGSSKTLKNMGRHYSAEEYMQITHRLRKYFPESTMTTDVIVGFPGETEEDLKDSMDFVEEIAFSHVHVFPFSPKKGTPAHDYDGQIPQKEKKRRVGVMSEAAGRGREKALSEMLGKTYKVLFEEQNSEGFWVGYSENYVLFAVKCEDDMANKICDVKALKICKEYIFGEI